MTEPDKTPRYAQAFAAGLIALMVACAVFAWEPWPFTSFRLFSTVRIDQQTAWLATTVDAAGREDPYPLGGETRGFRGFPFTMTEFTSASPSRRDELCRLWVASAPELVERDAVEVRIYQRSWILSDRSADEALPGQTDLRFVCDATGLLREAAPSSS